MTDYPANEWLRDITLLDHQPDDGQRVPVHVGHGILLNGRRWSADEILLGRDGITVAAGYDADGGLDATLVSFTVHDDHVHNPIHEGEEPSADRAAPALGPLKVLSPPGTVQPWEKFEDSHGQTWWRVYVYAANVTFGCRVPEPETASV